MPVPVAAVRVIPVRVIVIVARRLVHVAVVVRAGVGVTVGVAVLVGMRVGVGMVMDEIAVAMLVGMDVGMGMGVAMLVRVLVRDGVIVAVGVRTCAGGRAVFVVHGPLPRHRGSPAPITLRATVSPASTVILTCAGSSLKRVGTLPSRPA